jgi:endoglucanase
LPIECWNSKIEISKLFIMPKNTKSKSAPRNPIAPVFLKELLQARSPSGYEEEAREVVRKRMESVADSFIVDALGSCHATLGEKGSPTLYACRAY